MTSRERQASGGAALAARPAPPRAAAAAAPESRDPAAWEELFRCLPPDCQEELRALAARQGFLHAHQLPADPALVQQRRQLFANLLAGKVREPAPASSSPVALLDASLDAGQREAVARALNTPDICLIQGLPGSGKSRVAAEIVSQAAARGDSILLLSASTAGLDRVLEQAGRRDSVCAVRCLHPGEKPETLAACIRPYLLEERTRAVRETAVQNARVQAGTAEKTLRSRQEERPAWDRLAALAASFAALESRAAALEARRAALPQEVQQGGEAGQMESVAALLQQRDTEYTCQAKERAALQESREAALRERSPLMADHDALRPLAEALRRRRWWSLSWWKAKLRGGVLERDEELARRLAELDNKSAALALQDQELDRQREASEKRFEEQRRELIEREAAQRRESLDREAAELQREIDALQPQWEESCQALSSSRPSARASAALEAARAAWESRLKQDEQEAHFARRWAATLEEAAPLLAGRLLACANLIAATPEALAADNLPLAFDLLVVEESEQLSEADLALAARRARRWVLLGEPETPVPMRSNRAAAHRCGAFHRLWQHLHAAPRQLPFRWSRSESRLCCRLRAVPDDQRPWIHSEPVVDCPDIELFICAPPRQEPQLVEVRFPLTMPGGQAKTFILRELQEVAAHARGPAYLWHNSGECLRVQTGDVLPEAWKECERIGLEEGVCELVRAGDDQAVFETLGFEFDAAGGWTRARAERWLASRLGVHDSGRTAYLGRLHRPRAGLGSFLARLFRLSVPAAQTEEQVRFISVPDASVRVPAPRRAADTPPQRSGAGYEADLAHAGSAERLPAELRSALPRQGLINQPEAAALVQALEALVDDAAFRSESAAWQQGRLPDCCAGRDPLAGCQGSAANRAPAIAVTALYDSQVRLLRLLVSQSAALSRAGLKRLSDGHFRLDCPEPVEIVIESPPALRQRECLALFLSLTRSHSHRAVAFGEQAPWLPLALTRACGRLFLFGDPGTLARRTQWQGAVDHLDETSGERERELIACLLRHLPGADIVLPAAPAAEFVRR